MRLGVVRVTLPTKHHRLAGREAGRTEGIFGLYGCVMRHATRLPTKHHRLAGREAGRTEGIFGLCIEWIMSSFLTLRKSLTLFFSGVKLLVFNFDLYNDLFTAFLLRLTTFSADKVLN